MTVTLINAPDFRKTTEFIEAEGYLRFDVYETCLITTAEPSHSVTNEKIRFLFSHLKPTYMCVLDSTDYSDAGSFYWQDNDEHIICEWQGEEMIKNIKINCLPYSPIKAIIGSSSHSEGFAVECSKHKIPCFTHEQILALPIHYCQECEF